VCIEPVAAAPSVRVAILQGAGGSYELCKDGEDKTDQIKEANKTGGIKYKRRQT
jgi:hypothetical protein